VDALSGIEVHATDTQGVFTGTATGNLAGVWTATVDHTVLSPGATMTGGSFDLLTRVGGAPALVQGEFTGGGVTLLHESGSCGNQTYSVTGALGSVGELGGSQHGSGLFAATLTHYRISLFGACITYGATITGGTLTLLF
jgi:hypothetical protein